MGKLRWFLLAAGVSAMSAAFGQDTPPPPNQTAPAKTTTTTTTTVTKGPKVMVVLVDGKPVDFKNAPPQVVVGVTMVPLRGIFEAIGAYVEYDEANHRISARKNNESVDLLLGSRLAKKNGAEIMMEVKPQVIAGTTMVPLRFIAEALGAKVEFDKANNQIRITSGTDGSDSGLR